MSDRYIGDVCRKHDPLAAILQSVRDERVRQDKRWGEQNHPNGTGTIFLKFVSKDRRAETDRAFAAGEVTWRDILEEEVAEALAEAGGDDLRAELVQVMAVCAAWIEATYRAEGAA